MPAHTAVARRFAYLLDTLELTRAEFAAALDHAVSEHSLYSILNGHRRPSRSLAVLIERTWGYRAEYLLDGTGPMWAGHPARRAAPPADDAIARVLEVMSRSPEHARAVLRDLDDTALWTELWQRTTRMLEGLAENRDEPSDAVPPARLAFAECMEVADLYGELARLKYHRRIAHLIASFVRHLREHESDPQRHAPLLELATGREQALHGAETTLRAQLAERAAAPHPLAAPRRAGGGSLLDWSIRAAVQRL